MAKIIVTYGVPTDGFSALAGHELVIPPSGAAFSREELLGLLPEADAVLACTALDGELIAAGKKLRLIVCYGAGYDAIDVAAATSRDSGGQHAGVRHQTHGRNGHRAHHIAGPPPA